MPTLLVTQAEFDKAAPVFTSVPDLDCRPAPSDEATLAALVRETGCRAVVLGVAPYRQALYDALADQADGQGSLLIRFGFGTDSINKSYAASKGLTLVNTPVDIQTSVAELTLFLVGAVMRRITQLDATIRGGGFQAVGGHELHGRKALIIGGGRIGLKVARMLHLGFDVDVLVHDVASEDEWVVRTGETHETLRICCGIERYSQDLDALLPEADLVLIHLPLTPGTQGLIGAERLARMKRGSVLVNAGRGGIVDEAALYDALASGHLDGAASDVFVTEPYVPAVPDKDLRLLPNMVLTPHSGSNTAEANARMAASAVRQAAAFFAGDNHLLHRVPLTS
ncbi:MAG TPA: NAD(P)-dependent oxidoreductase [Kiritimatiellia bacterium]|nr:NAD(P)-dependent oxidoreductase [Kiritimatiellia bacterium]